MKINALCALFLIAGCAPDAPATSTLPGGDGKADNGGPTTLGFRLGAAPTQSGALHAGHPARIQYDLDRLTGCRGNNGQGDAWGVSAYLRADGRDQPVVALTELRSGRAVATEGLFNVPEGGELEIWFTVSDVYGCVAYDSDYGKNFHFRIESRPAATVHFEADFAENVEGQLHNDAELIIDYALARMPNCPKSTPWVDYKVDGGPVSSRQLNPGSDAERVTTRLAMPAGAHEVEMWFARKSGYGCREFDSDFGSNYRFALE